VCHSDDHGVVVVVGGQVPVELRGGLTKREREAILGYCLAGV
jgi:hypothetical protein